MASSSMTTSSKGRTSHFELSMSLLAALDKGGLLSGSLEEVKDFLKEEKFGPFKPKGASKAASAHTMWLKNQFFEKGTTIADRSALWKTVDDEEREHYQKLADAKNAEDGKEVVKKVSKGISTTGWTLHQQKMKASGKFTRTEISAAWASKTEAEKAVMNAAAHKSNLEKSLDLAKELEAPKTLPPVKVPAKPKKPKKSKAEKAAEKKAAEKKAQEEAEKLTQDSGEESSDGEEEQ